MLLEHGTVGIEDKTTTSIPSYDTYTSEAGLDEAARDALEILKDEYGEVLEIFREVPYPEAGIVPQEFVNRIRDDLIPAFDVEEGAPADLHKDIIFANPAVMQLALLHPGIFSALRAPEFSRFWRECFAYINRKHCNKKFPVPPKSKNIFDHMMGVHLEMRGLKFIKYDLDALSENYGKAVTKEVYKAQVQQALPYFVQAARFGSISAIYHIIDFYQDMLRFADIPAPLTNKLLSYAETLAQTLPTALGSLGYLYMLETYSHLSECIEKYGVKRLGLTEKQADDMMARYDESQMLALLKAEKLRFHETSVDIFKGHEASLERHRKRLSSDRTSSFGEDTQMWTRLITYYVPFRYFLNGTGYDLRHDTVFLPVFDESGVVPYQYGKLLSKEGVATLNMLAKQTNSEAKMLERTHASLDFEPFADVASEMMLNLDFTQPAKQARYFQPASTHRQSSQSSEHSLTLSCV